MKCCIRLCKGNKECKEHGKIREWMLPFLWVLFEVAHQGAVLFWRVGEPMVAPCTKFLQTREEEERSFAMPPS